MNNYLLGTWLPIIVLFLLIYWPKKKQKRIFASHQLLKRKLLDNDNKEKKIMKELAQRFIGKDCIIKMLDGTVDGVITEVTDGGIVLEYNEKVQIINLDYVMKIREFPYKKGKRSSFVGD